jgi:hypothetical protein
MGDPGATRTRDTQFRKLLLYPLSYGAVAPGPRCILSGWCACTSVGGVRRRYHPSVASLITGPEQEASVVQREALTIRFPVALLSRARKIKAERESLNELVVEAVDREVRRRQGLAAHEAILRIRGRVRARTGPHPDPVPLIRELRAGEERRG